MYTTKSFNYLNKFIERKRNKKKVIIVWGLLLITIFLFNYLF